MKVLSTQMKTIAVAFSIITCLMTSSCKKENSTADVSETEAQTIAEESTLADAEYDEVAEMGLSTSADMETIIGRVSTGGDAGLNGGTSILTFDFSLGFFADLSFKTGPCTKVSVFPLDSSFPKTVTINFGDGCICKDGKFRKGQVTLTYSAPIRRPGAVLTIKLNEYYVNRTKIEGTKTLRNESSGGTWAYSATVVDGRVTLPGGRGFGYAAVKTVTQIKGSGTLTVRDDSYSVSGRSSAHYNNGVQVTKNTETALVKSVACQWTTSGIMKIKVNNRTVFVDFGYGVNADCDNKALLTWANGETVITLP